MRRPEAPSATAPVTRRIATRLAAGALAAGALALPAGAQTLTFEGLGPTYTYVGSAYAPYVFQGTAQVVDNVSYGELNCEVSGVFCLYNGTGAQDVNIVRNDAGQFTLQSGYFTSWFGSTTATVTGLLGGSTVFSMSFPLTSTATLQSFGNDLVDEIQLRANGYFLADDLSLVSPTATTAPEPASLALLGGGLAALGFVARRRRRG